MNSLKLRLYLRTDGCTEEYVTELTIQRDAIEGIIQRAAGKSGGPEWACVSQEAPRFVLNALLQWAEKVCKRSVELERQPRELLDCLASSLKGFHGY